MSSSWSDIKNRFQVEPVAKEWEEFSRKVTFYGDDIMPFSCEYFNLLWWTLTKATSLTVIASQDKQITWPYADCCIRWMLSSWPYLSFWSKFWIWIPIHSDIWTEKWFCAVSVHSRKLQLNTTIAVDFQYLRIGFKAWIVGQGVVSGYLKTIVLKSCVSVCLNLNWRWNLSWDLRGRRWEERTLCSHLIWKPTVVRVMMPHQQLSRKVHFVPYSVTSYGSWNILNYFALRLFFGTLVKIRCSFRTIKVWKVYCTCVPNYLRIL
jgi:hypothetical protein